MECFAADAVFMDIDGTMTGGDGTRNGMDHSPLEHLEDMLMEKTGMERQEALERIQACGDMAVQCLSEFLEELQLSSEEYFQRMRSDLSAHIFITPDTVEFLHAMKAMGIPVYTATTNSPFMTRVKLSLGGLADLNCSPWIAGYYSGASFRNPLGKYAPDFYDRIILQGRFNPEHLVMIGDEPERDGLPALRAGFHLAVNIDRSQSEDFRAEGNYIFVNDLRHLMPYLLPHRAA